MPLQRLRLHRYRPFVLLILIVHLQACFSSWQPATVSPPQVIEAEEPQEVRITRTNGEQVTIRSPEVWADSIAGTEGGDPVSVGLSDVRRIEVKRFSGGRVIALGFLMVVGAITVSLVTLVGQVEGDTCEGEEAPFLRCR